MSKKTKNEKILNIAAINIRRERKKLRYSQEELAELAGVHRTYVGFVERSEINMTLTNLAKFAKALGVEITELLIEK